MNEEPQKWNVVLATRFKRPSKYMEFSVESKTLLGATMKANKTLKSLNEKEEKNIWKIMQVYWLHPAAHQKEIL